MTADLIEKLVAGVTIAAGADPTPPIDLERIARYLGVESIEDASMVEDGRLEQIAGRSRVYVRSGTPLARRRFTIAHELGHIVLAGREAEFIAHRSGTAVDPEERFCNQFAGALLVPKLWLMHNVPRGHESLATARLVSQATGTSLAASVVRLREVLGWRSSLLQWRCTNGVWRLSTTVGLPHKMNNRVTSTPGTRAALTEARGSQERQVVIPLAVDGEPVLVRGYVSARGAWAALLARLA